MNDNNQSLIELSNFWKENNKEVNLKYPDFFDPIWTITESGWPFFKLSRLDNQPWNER